MTDWSDGARILLVLICAPVMSFIIGYWYDRIAPRRLTYLWERHNAAIARLKRKHA